MADAVAVAVSVAVDAAAVDADGVDDVAVANVEIVAAAGGVDVVADAYVGIVAVAFDFDAFASVEFAAEDGFCTWRESCKYKRFLPCLVFCLEADRALQLKTTRSQCYKHFIGLFLKSFVAVSVG